MNKIKLYIKTHNITGLKYFGKTAKCDIESYRGSGVYWTNHINFHGYDVTTELLGEFFEDDPLLVEVATRFSNENDIVNSKEWANLAIENGLNGGCFGYKHTQEALDKISISSSERIASEETKEKISKSKQGQLKGIPKSKEHKEKISTALKDKPLSEETKEKMRGPRPQCCGEGNSQFGWVWIYNLELKISKTIKREEFPSWEQEGWLKGRKMKFN